MTSQRAKTHQVISNLKLKRVTSLAKNIKRFPAYVPEEDQLLSEKAISINLSLFSGGKVSQSQRTGKLYHCPGIPGQWWTGKREIAPNSVADTNGNHIFASV